eukprot:TRINITY_DN1286_c0_g1_i2.p1 TRINITY_DN1286_c0_g1~~TRINITY_DN1286_c0_g1_i2.p1  ORF type:complete len:431 (+),score=79.85 TRINITY_DN1286_c0_g1_i2:62-1354(+)
MWVCNAAVRATRNIHEASAARRLSTAHEAAVAPSVSPGKPVRNKLQLTEGQRVYKLTDEQVAEQNKGTAWKKYYAANKQQLADKKRQYVAQNKEKVQHMKKAYYQSHKAEIKQYKKEYNQANHSKIGLKNAEYYQQNKEELSRYYQEKRASQKEETKRLLNEDPEAKKFFELSLSINTKNDWYEITQKKMEAIKWKGVRVAKYMSLCDILKILYPDEKWIEGKFRVVPKGTWGDPIKVREYLVSLSPSLFIEKPDDWDLVSLTQLQEVGAGGCVATFQNRVFNLLSFAFPEIKWDAEKFSHRGKKSSERILINCLRLLFPRASTIIQNHLHPDLYWNKDYRKVQLDVWIPDLQLAFEFQGQQHYHELRGAFGDSSSLKKNILRDEAKQKMCDKAAITLVQVPYWWDSSLTSLSEIVRETRPDLVEERSQE